MLIDLTQTFVNADDSPAVIAGTQTPVTLKFMLIQAILAEASPDGRPVPPDEKIKRYSVYRDLKKAGATIELPAEDVALLKDAAKIFPTLTLGQTHEMLERTAVKPIPFKERPDFDAKGEPL
jgi:hypothetical protein